MPGIRFPDAGAPSSSFRRRRAPVAAEEDEDDSSRSGNESSNASSEQRDARDGEVTSIRRSPSTHLEKPEHQRGSIIRIRMRDFVTYSSAEFICGPSLNMIIGPNGTGKSTLVCAICLGLGSQPTNLGRAKSTGEYIKNGKQEATIEIELKGGAGKRNIIVKRLIKRKDNKNVFWLNGEETTQKRVRETMQSLNIQIENLCQFLPQDRVVEFAQMTPIQLLEQTQKAVADPEVSEWHEELKLLGSKRQKLFEDKASRQAYLAEITTRQNQQRADIDRIEQRRATELRREILVKNLPLFEYNAAFRKVGEAKEELTQAKAQYRQLNDELGPALATVNRKKEYGSQVKAERDTLTNRITHAKSAVTIINASIASFKEKIQACDAEIDIDRAAQKKRKEDISRVKHNITKLERTTKEPPPDFDAVDMNRQIREYDANIESSKAQQRDYAAQVRQRVTEYKAKVQEKAGIENSIESLKSQTGRLKDQLRTLSADSAKAYEWLQEKKHLFQGEVYGPPLLTCSMKNQQFTDAAESALGKGDFLTFTVTNNKDFQTLQHHLLSRGTDCLSLTDITIKQATRPLSSFQAPVANDALHKLGFDGWLLDTIDGPEPVLAMLSESAGLHRTAYTARSQSDADFERVKSSPVQRWATKDSLFVIVTRREYNQSSVNASNLRKARFWIEQPIDETRQQELKRSLHELNAELETLKEEGTNMRQQSSDLDEEIAILHSQRRELVKEKEQLQKQRSEFESLPRVIAADKDKLQSYEESYNESTAQISSKEQQKYAFALDRAKAATRLPAALKLVKRRLQEFIDAQLRLIEADSDLVALEATNRTMVQQLEASKSKVEELTRVAQRLKDRVKEIRAEATELMQSMTDEEHDIVQEYKDAETGQWIADIDEIKADIQSLESRLELFGADNPLISEAYARRAIEIENTTTRVEQIGNELADTEEKISDTKGKWEPVLDNIAEKISEAFSWNFEQIGCAGQVEIHKEEDFSQWAIRIKVKFRENEQLSILDSHRQSGGERAVSTIFYLMSLQALARSPFRVVDEINQGMDPRNERMVHERMVDIACEENTSQYFLVTPKLLPGLKYHERMVVHVIYSGENMPSESADGPSAKLDLPMLANLALRVRAQG